jgi:hypothetical protein
MSEIVDFTTRKTTTTEPPRGPFPPPGMTDEAILNEIMKWKAARARMLLDTVRAERGQDANPEHWVDCMCEAQNLFSRWKPETIGTAFQLLEVAVEIMGYRHIDKRHPFAKGPVLRIVRNVTRQLEWMDGDIRLEPHPAPSPAEPPAPPASFPA